MDQVSLNINFSSYKNVLDKNIKLFMKFDSLPLTDEISGQNIEISNEQSPFIEESVIGNGLRMRPKSTISSPLLLTNPAEFTIGFWLRPSWISPTVSPLTNLPVYYRMALLDKSNYSYSNSTGFVSAVDATFSVYEESREDGFNVMTILLQSRTGLQSTFQTKPYLTDKMHHFWISYYGPSRSLYVHLDGVLVDLFSEDGFPVPVSLNTSALVKFHINSSAVGYGSLIRNNGGLLDEVVFSNQFIVDSNVISKVINYGVEHAIDKSLLYKEFVNESFIFDDPTALGVTSVLSNGKNFYAGRNDGSLFKGDRTMWQVKRDFSVEDESKFVKKNIFASDSIVTIEKGSLKIFKASVRI